MRADDLVVLGVGDDSADLEVDGVRRRFDVARYGSESDSWDVEVDSSLGPVSLAEGPRYPDPAAAVAAGSLLAPMPGAVIRVAVAEGESVTAGQPLLWMEAMKMEHTITAGADGVVTSLPVAVGDQVGAGDVLVVVSDPADAETDTETGTDAGTDQTTATTDTTESKE